MSDLLQHFSATTLKLEGRGPLISRARAPRTKANRIATLWAVLGACAQWEINQPSSPMRQTSKLGGIIGNNKCGTRAFAQIAGRTPVFVIADAGLLAA
jgi:hypothetical protein